MRELDIVVHGATGFTGALTAAFLAAHAPPDLRLGLSGRSLPKLRAVHDQLQAQSPRPLTLIEADAHAPASLASLAQRTRVVATTVGPYMKHGLPLVAACAEAGTHYADLTGEVPFMQRSIAGYHALAQRSGARIVHTCGYDSIPSDLGALVLQDALAQQGAPATRLLVVVGPAKGGFSGGTVASLLAVLEAAQDDAVRRAMLDPYALDPADDRGHANSRDNTSVQHVPELGRWAAPFVMAPVNTRVVRRSHALLGRPWGPDFRYEELMGVGRGARGWASAHAIRAALGALLLTASRPTLRERLVRPLVPQPGTGPSEAQRKAGHFTHTILAFDERDQLMPLRGVVKGQGDPGYAATAAMLSASALLLAGDHADLPERAGVLTPATALGLPLARQLAGFGVSIQATQP